jgi:hypothetical protein
MIGSIDDAVPKALGEGEAFLVLRSGGRFVLSWSNPREGLVGQSSGETLAEAFAALDLSKPIGGEAQGRSERATEKARKRSGANPPVEFPEPEAPGSDDGIP